MRRLSLHVASVLGLLLLTFFTQQVLAQNNTVTVNFNNLPPGTIVTNQYLPHLTFSGNGFSAPSSYPYGTDVVTRSLSPYAPYNGGVDSRVWYYYNQFGDTTSGGDVFLDFKLPVNNLKFYILNSNQSYLMGKIYIWVNGQYYGYRDVYGSGNLGQPGPPILIDLSGIQHITGVQLASLAGCDFIYTNRCWPVIFDDFTFTPDVTVNITNPRVSGNLQGTTQNALVGADVSLQAGASKTGGTYSWSFTGSPTVVSGATNQASVGVRWTQTGTYRATVTYTVNGVLTSWYVDVNVRIPTLSSFTAQQYDDVITRDQGCSAMTNGAAYSLGCYKGGPVYDGIVWTPTTQIPSVTYLSDPAQSGIKFIQAVSLYRKYILNGSTMCLTSRTGDNPTSQQNNVDSGWRLDTLDPYGQVHRFNEGTTITMTSMDAPSHRLDIAFAPLQATKDIVTVDDRFETYVFYFTGPDPGNPIFQKPLELQNPPDSVNRIGRIAWSWNGEVIFNWGALPQKYRFSYSNTSPGQINATGTSAVRSMALNINTLTPVACAGTVASQNVIDGSREFVREHYVDFFGPSRDPSVLGASQQDLTGWDFWMTPISNCAYNYICIKDTRANAVSRAFWESGDFRNKPEVQSSGLLTGNASMPYDYHQFIRWCYKIYLGREPDAGGWNFWTSELQRHGDYNRIIKAFLESQEYRDRYAGIALY